MEWKCLTDPPKQEGFYLTIWQKYNDKMIIEKIPLINIILLNYNKKNFEYVLQQFWININPHEHEFMKEYEFKEEDGSITIKKYSNYRIWHPDHWYYPTANNNEIYYIRIPFNKILFDFAKINNDIDCSYFISTEKRLIILKKYNYKCIYCKDSPAINEKCQLQIDHIYPQSLGGSSNINNLQVLCHRCNGRKNNKEITNEEEIKQICQK